MRDLVRLFKYTAQLIKISLCLLIGYTMIFCMIKFRVIRTPRFVSPPPAYQDSVKLPIIATNETGPPPPSPPPPLTSAPEPSYDRALVVAAMNETDQEWIHHSRLAAWQKHVYISDLKVTERPGDLVVPAQKGNEAMVYLTYIIENYYTLLPVSVFVHGHFKQWHSPFPDQLTSTVLERIRLEAVQRLGYANLRCQWDIGCSNFNLNMSELNSTNAFYDNFFTIFPDRDSYPEIIAMPCCAQFAASADSIRRHPRDYYVYLRDWLINTNLPSYDTGRVFEYSWHMIFGQEPVNCPSEQHCYCDLYGTNCPQVLSVHVS